MQRFGFLASLLMLASLLCASTAFVVAPTSAGKASVATTAPTTSYNRIDTRRYLDLGSMISNWGRKVKVSHILIGPATSKTGKGMDQDDAIAKLNELKTEIGNDATKFAAAAEEYSTCRASSTQGGDLGEYGPGLLVEAIDKICFNEEVGVVHGPVSSPYGEHLVLIRERTEK